MIKAIKVYIGKPLNSSWDELGKLLNSMSYDTARAYNYCMSELYQRQAEKEKIREQKGNYPTAKEYPMPKSRLYQAIA